MALVNGLYCSSNGFGCLDLAEMKLGFCREWLVNDLIEWVTVLFDKSSLNMLVNRTGLLTIHEEQICKHSTIKKDDRSTNNRYTGT
ncbi:MAG: hypothetical protein WAM42_25385 [Candidatus Nitrosopolaris sp.]